MTASSPRPEPVPEPDRSLADPRALLTGHLDRYRDAALRKLDGLDPGALRTSRLPSGWSPLELLHHLAHVERRWLVWGYLGETVETPWGDDDPATGRWRVPDGAGPREVRDLFLSQAERSRRIVAEAPSLEVRAAATGRFGTPGEAPTLMWILFHLLQEYARHVGHLDVVRELADGSLGE